MDVGDEEDGLGLQVCQVLEEGGVALRLGRDHTPRTAVLTWGGEEVERGGEEGVMGGEVGEGRRKKLF